MIWFIIVLATFLRVLNLNQSFWLDEAAQLVESARPLSQQLQIAGDFQPPLFHLLLHFWLYVGRGEVWVRLLPVIFGVTTVYMTYRLVLQLSNRKIALLTALFLAIAPFHIWYSQEVRPYALSVLLATTSTYLLITRRWVFYTISAIGFIYSLYLAPFLLIAHGLYVLLFQRKTLGVWLFSMLVVSIAFFPWIPAFLEQLHIGSSLTTSLPGWSEAVSSPVGKSLPLVFAKFVFGRITIDNKIIYGGLTALVFALCSWLGLLAVRKYPRLSLRAGVFLILPILLASVVSFFLPILAPQRVLFGLPFFYLLLAIGLTNASKKGLFWLVFVCISMYSFYLYMNSPRFQREHWREAINYVEMNRTAKTVAAFIFPDSFAPWQWYQKGIVENIALAPHFQVNRDDLEKLTNKLQQYERVYLFGYLSDLTDPQQQIPIYLQELGFVQTHIKDFPGVGFVYTYERALALY